jgi:hypothetical protein
VNNEVQHLVALIERDPSSFFVIRQPGNYSLFLELYQKVGYAPAESADLLAWQQRSREIWTRMDQSLPGTYTGGLSGDSLVSAAGTLPLSTTAIYGHSFCMLKCPEAAVTLHAQSLEKPAMDGPLPIGRILGRFVWLSFPLRNIHSKAGRDDRSGTVGE